MPPVKGSADLDMTKATTGNAAQADTPSANGNHPRGGGRIEVRGVSKTFSRKATTQAGYTKALDDVSVCF